MSYTIECKICNKITISKLSWTKYCSESCRRIAIRNRMRELHGFREEEKTCVTCQKTFSSAKKVQKNCSKECTKEYNKQYNQDRYCFKINETTGSKEKIIHGHLKLRFEIFKRDKFTCVYCGRNREDSAKLHVDHRLARHNGGSDDYSNLVTSCEECNLGKSDVLLTESSLSS